MGLAWESLSLEKQRAYRDVFSRTPERSVHYTFASLWGWNANCDYEWAWDGGLVWVRANRPGRLVMAPAGDWDSVDWGSALSKLWPGGSVFLDIPAGLARRWEHVLPGRVKVVPARSEWEYVHKVDNLVTLRGNRFRSKAQKLRRFIETFAPDYVPVGPQNLDEVRAFQEEWCRTRGCEQDRYLLEEDRAISSTLDGWENLEGLFGGALKVKGRMVAYTLAEPVDAETVAIRFEKASPDFRDAYQAVNQLFLERACVGFAWVNREEDMGDPGMREAKMSYRPDRFLEKFTVTLE